MLLSETTLPPKFVEDASNWKYETVEKLYDMINKVNRAVVDGLLECYGLTFTEVKTLLEEHLNAKSVQVSL